MATRFKYHKGALGKSQGHCALVRHQEDVASKGKKMEGKEKHKHSPRMSPGKTGQ